MLRAGMCKLTPSLSTGTFRPDRIRAIADRFGVDGNMALENILYGQLGVINYLPCMTFISPSVQQRTSGKKNIIICCTN